MKRFVCGLFVGLFAIPLCEDVSSLLANWIEVAKGGAAVRIAKINKQVAEIEEPYEQVSAIGFEYMPEEEYVDEEDKYLKQRGMHFGF